MHCRMKTRVTIRRPFLLSAALFTLLPASLAGQGGRSLGVSLPHGPGNAIQIASHRGYPAFDASALGPLEAAPRKPFAFDSPSGSERA